MRYAFSRASSVLLLIMSLGSNAMADLTYKTYAGTGAYPTFPGNGGSLYYGTVLSTGTVTSLDYNWGSGVVLDSGRNERVIVNFYGYITIPDTGSQDIQFYLYADDGVYMKIDGTVVINDWNEQAPGMWNYISTDQTLTGGQTYYIDAWWYENGGGAAFRLYWNQSGSTALVPSSAYSTTEPVVTVSITSNQQTTVNTTRNKTQAGNKIYMTQSGSGIDLDIVQDGDDNLIIGEDLTSAANITGDSIELTITQKNTDNVLGIDINGNSNDVDIWQDTSQRALVDIDGSSNTLDLEQLHLSGSGAHHSSINIEGNSNNVTIDQKETGDKTLFLDINSSNTVDIDQLGTGEHFLDVDLTDNHTLTVTQDGSGSHDALIDLSGNPTTLTLTQDSATDQNYHLQQSCVATTCSATVTQN